MHHAGMQAIYFAGRQTEGEQIPPADALTGPVLLTWTLLAECQVHVRRGFSVRHSSKRLCAASFHRARAAPNALWQSVRIHISVVAPTQPSAAPDHQSVIAVAVARPLRPRLEAIHPLLLTVPPAILHHRQRPLTHASSAPSP